MVHANDMTHGDFLIVCVNAMTQVWSGWCQERLTTWLEGWESQSYSSILVSGDWRQPENEFNRSGNYSIIGIMRRKQKLHSEPWVSFNGWQYSTHTVLCSDASGDVFFKSQSCLFGILGPKILPIYLFLPISDVFPFAKLSCIHRCYTSWVQ